jgi:hypothetical protein
VMQAHPARKNHPVALLHRHGGIVAALFVIVVCITGIALNHTDSLGLNKRMVNVAWLMQWYGIKPPQNTSYAIGDSYISHSGTRLLLNGQTIAGQYPRVSGAIQLPNYNVVALNDSLLLLTPDGTVIEALRQVHGVPANIHRIGQQNGHVLLQTQTGIWRSGPQLLAWVQIDLPARDIYWSEPVDTPATLEKNIASMQTGEGLTLERLILDLHSGRMLGRAGPWLADMVAVLFTTLALSGIWMWFKALRRNRGKMRPTI